MTLNATFERMIVFRDDLVAFSDALRDCLADVQDAEERLSAWWDDDFAVAFRKQHDEIAAPLGVFTATDCPHFVEFLDQKIALLRGYLGHA